MNEYDCYYYVLCKTAIIITCGFAYYIYKRQSNKSHSY